MPSGTQTSTMHIKVYQPARDLWLVMLKAKNWQHIISDHPTKVEAIIAADIEANMRGLDVEPIEDEVVI